MAEVKRSNLVTFVTLIMVVVLVVVAGVCVKFFVGEPYCRIILIALISLLIMIGILSVSLVEYKRKRSAKKGTKQNGSRTNSRYSAAPTSNKKSSWSYQRPPPDDTFSNRTTLEA